MIRRLCASALSSAALLLAACSGSSFGGGTAIPGGVNPPVNAQQPIPGANPTVSPMYSASPLVSATGAPASHAFADASTTGIACPSVNGYSCTLYFNQPPETPKPSPAPSGKGKAAPSPTPTPTATPTPTPSPAASGSPAASPTASPTPSAQLNVTLESNPKDAPKMVNPDPKAIATLALVALTLSPTADITINGRSTAIFTLPKEQIGGRGFAIQFYQQSVRHKKTERTFFGSYNVSTIKDDSLTFSYTVPKFTIKKGETWLVVLYGDEKPSASAGPSSSPAASVSPSPSANPSPTASASSAP